MSSHPAPASSMSSKIKIGTARRVMNVSRALAPGPSGILIEMAAPFKATRQTRLMLKD